MRWYALFFGVVNTAITAVALRAPSPRPVFLKAAVSLWVVAMVVMVMGMLTGNEEEADHG